jgi:hypothetical protein
MGLPAVVTWSPLVALVNVARSAALTAGRLSPVTPYIACRQSCRPLLCSCDRPAHVRCLSPLLSAFGKTARAVLASLTLLLAACQLSALTLAGLPFRSSSVRLPAVVTRPAPCSSRRTCQSRSSLGRLTLGRHTSLRSVAPSAFCLVVLLTPVVGRRWMSCTRHASRRAPTAWMPQGHHVPAALSAGWPYQDGSFSQLRLTVLPLWS